MSLIFPDGSYTQTIAPFPPMPEPGARYAPYAGSQTGGGFGSPFGPQGGGYPPINTLAPRQPPNPYSGLEDLRDMYFGVSPDELRRLQGRMDQARRDDAANRYRQDMERYAPQYEQNRRAENQRLEDEMRRRQQQPQPSPVERRDPREWQDGRMAPPGSPVGVYPRPPFGGRPPQSGPPQLFGGQAQAADGYQNPATQRYAGMSKGDIFQQTHGYRYGQQPAMGDMASWGSQQAAQAALPGRQITQYGPGSFGSAGGEPTPGGYGRQLYRPGMAQPIQPQSQGTPYGAPPPWGNSGAWGSSPQRPSAQASGGFDRRLFGKTGQFGAR